jgi:hypothetical protein
MSIENPTPNPFSREAHEARVAAQNASGNVMEAYGNQPVDVEIDDKKQVPGDGDTITVLDFGSDAEIAQREARRAEQDAIDQIWETPESLAEMKRRSRGDVALDALDVQEPDTAYHAVQQNKPPLTAEQVDGPGTSIPKVPSIEVEQVPESVDQESTTARSEFDSIKVIEIKRAILEYTSLMYSAKRSEDINGYNADSNQDRIDAKAKIHMLPSRYRDLAERYYIETQVL